MNIEECKRYVRRGGGVSRPIRPTDSRGIYCWTDGWLTYTRSGRLGSDHNKTTKFDLVAE